MAWTPDENVIDASVLDANLLAYIATNQSDALLWANGSALTPFKTIANNVADRSKPKFPLLMIRDSSDAIDYSGGDAITAVYQVIFECMFASVTALTVTNVAKKYDQALKSMLANIPKATLVNGMTNSVGAFILTLESTFDELKTNEKETRFGAGWDVRASYQIIGSRT